VVAAGVTVGATVAADAPVGAALDAGRTADVHDPSTPRRRNRDAARIVRIDGA
jgi:hypothetical protein